MKIVVGADHGGFRLKSKIRKWLEDKGWEVEDVGARKYNKGDDFVDFARKVAQRVKGSEGTRGLVLCRNGVGMDIVCNRYRGVRSVLGFGEKQVRRAREDDKVNVLSLPADYISLRKAKRLVKVFLETDFSDKERFRRRLKKLEKLGV